jgi:hypothetical protein
MTSAWATRKAIISIAASLICGALVPMSTHTSLLRTARAEPRRRPHPRKAAPLTLSAEDCVIVRGGVHTGEADVVDDGGQRVGRRPPAVAAEELGVPVEGHHQCGGRRGAPLAGVPGRTRPVVGADERIRA